MSSKDIAKLTGKRHDNVMADIRTMLNEIQSPEILGDYKDGRGRKQPCILLNKDESMCLVSGYNAKLRMAIIKRWQELESKQSPKLPSSFAEALQLAADQAKQLELAAPKVEFHDTVVQSDHTYKYQEAGKKIQQRPNIFIKWLRDNGYLMANNVPYQKCVDLGIMIINTDVNSEGFEYTQGRITTKGLAYFTKKLDGIKL